MFAGSFIYVHAQNAIVVCQLQVIGCAAGIVLHLGSCNSSIDLNALGIHGIRVALLPPEPLAKARVGTFL